MNSKILFAIDPGKTVGWAQFEVFENSKVELQKCGQTEWKRFLKIFKLKVESGKKFEVVIENYTVRSTTISANLNKELLTAKVIGVIEFFCRQNNIKWTLQPAGIGNAFFDKERLKGMGMWEVGKRHARDAIRHGLWFITFNKNWEGNQ